MNPHSRFCKSSCQCTLPLSDFMTPHDPSTLLFPQTIRSSSHRGCALALTLAIPLIPQPHLPPPICHLPSAILVVASYTLLLYPSMSVSFARLFFPTNHLAYLLILVVYHYIICYLLLTCPPCAECPLLGLLVPTLVPGPWTGFAHVL